MTSEQNTMTSSKQNTMALEQNITPDVVRAPPSGVDYNKLIEQFGCVKIDDELLGRFQVLHRFLRRGLFFSHRDLDKIMTAHEKGQEIYLYTGRGPSAGSMHIGHLVPFMFCKYLQDVFKCKLVIQITDDEKLMKTKGLTFDQVTEYTRSNIKDIVACGFNPENTFIFTNLDYMGKMYPTVVKLQSMFLTSQVTASFGIVPADCIGKLAFPAVQAAPCFPECFPHLFENRHPRVLIPCGIDQDPYFRLTRDVCNRMKAYKPSLIHSKFIPGLQGIHTKMSSSDQKSAIFLDDTPSTIAEKITRAMSGGRETKQEQDEKGADLDKDVPFQYLKVFLEDDQELKQIEDDYSTGKLSSLQVKMRLVDVITELVKDHQLRRKELTDEYISQFMKY